MSYSILSSASIPQLLRSPFMTKSHSGGPLSESVRDNQRALILRGSPGHVSLRTRPNQSNSIICFRACRPAPQTDSPRLYHLVRAMLGAEQIIYRCILSLEVYGLANWILVENLGVPRAFQDGEERSRTWLEGFCRNWNAASRPRPRSAAEHVECLTFSFLRMPRCLGSNDLGIYHIEHLACVNLIGTSKSLNALTEIYRHRAGAVSRSNMTPLNPRFHCQLGHEARRAVITVLIPTVHSGHALISRNSICTCMPYRIIYTHCVAKSRPSMGRPVRTRTDMKSLALMTGGTYKVWGQRVVGTSSLGPVLSLPTTFDIDQSRNVRGIMPDYNPLSGFLQNSEEYERRRQTDFRPPSVSTSHTLCRRQSITLVYR